MKITLLLSLYFSFISIVKGQDTTTIIISPDLKVDFPCKPKHTTSGKTEKHECEYSNQIYCITSEPFPINYKGVEIEEANAKFYPSFTQKLVNGRKIKLLVEKDTLFENHRSKELRFIEISPEGKEKHVLLRAIMVSGIAEALYIVTLTNNESNAFTQTQMQFLKSLDLYYNFEHDLDFKTEKERKKIIKKKGYKYKK